jgi:hypothetical protein
VVITATDSKLNDLDLGLITSVSIGALYALTTGYSGRNKAVDLFQDIIFHMRTMANIALPNQQGCLVTNCLTEYENKELTLQEYIACVVG